MLVLWKEQTVRPGLFIMINWLGSGMLVGLLGLVATCWTSLYRIGLALRNLLITMMVKVVRIRCCILVVLCMRLCVCDSNLLKGMRLPCVCRLWRLCT